MLGILKQYVFSGVSRHYKDETNRRIMVVNLFAAVGMSITFILGCRAFFAAEYSLSTTLFTASVVFAISQRLQVRVATPRARTASITLLILCLMVLTLLLLITGGKDNTGPLWIYLVPPVTMFFAGFIRGLLSLISFTMVSAVIMFGFDEAILVAQYTYAFKTRLLYSFMTVSFLSAFYEYSRQKSYDTALYLSEQFERQAKHDHLTQLLNRRGAQQCLEREYARVVRNKSKFSIAIADIDRFKSINDTLGHEQGDEVLVQISKVFTSRLRKQDIIARWGGEEFMFIFNDTDEAGAVQALEQIRKTLNQAPLNINGREFHVTSSFGVSEVTPGIDISYAIRCADKALYYAKDNGRDQVCSISSISPSPLSEQRTSF
ncbi:diguanylate cyclase [Alteromonas marina]|jgi:diguanylate cyclase (GGDEF)-like protein|uniref:diguanylate cyclase n=1 Tax=Alteromonas marina TaxID=203795 RepID=A0A0B3YPY5_9ALTE|nr:GGDEF domain-containing protein [Alteromonas marina]KHT56782.1 diguanylate cyclase [Alteromonas marina]|tara:strand:+ start:1365 stop:2492 length:1128 start_codon:yes stop_codon:yes gene_type:complete